MAAMVLNGSEVTAMSVFVVRAFVRMREQLVANAAILKRLAEIDKTLLEHDQVLGAIWEQLQPLLAPPPDPPKRRMDLIKILIDGMSSSAGCCPCYFATQASLRVTG